jgi:DNA-binding transcriptional LysR family regulator
VPESVVASPGPLRAVRFRGAALKRTVGLASRRDRPFSPAASAFVDALNTFLDKGATSAPTRS